jgi:hypothetical protein
MSTGTGPRPSRAWQKSPKIDTETLQHNLQQAVNSAFQIHPSTYQKVAVVMVHFANDDTGAVPLETELGEVFEKCYNYRIKHVQIPVNQSAHAYLYKQLNVIVMNGFTDEGCLVILVFSGHGESYKVQNTNKYHLRVG